MFDASWGDGSDSDIGSVAGSSGSKKGKSRARACSALRRGFLSSATSEGNGSNGHLETGNRSALAAKKEARRHKLAARPFPEKVERGVPPGDGRSGVARARHRSARMEDRRARRLIHALTLTLSQEGEGNLLKT